MIEYVGSQDAHPLPVRLAYHCHIIKAGHMPCRQQYSSLVAHTEIKLRERTRQDDDGAENEEPV